LPTLIAVRAQGSRQTMFFVLGSSPPGRSNTHSSGVDYPKLLPARKFRRCGSFKRGLDGRIPVPSWIVAVTASCAFARSLALTGSSFGWQCVVPAGTDTVCWRGSSAVAKDR
jgi:hypothetical protein